MTPDGKKALAEFGFEVSGPGEPTPGLISVRLSAVLQQMEPALRVPVRAPAALKEAYQTLQRLVQAIDAYEIAKAEADEPREPTKQYQFNLGVRTETTDGSIEAQLDEIERNAADAAANAARARAVDDLLASLPDHAPAHEQTMRYQLVRNGPDPALVVTPSKKPPPR